MKNILISGAGVAGLTAACLLRRDGHAVTVVERAPSFRLGGQPVDVRGPALDVVDRIGLIDAVRAAKTRMQGMSILDAAGTEIERTTEWTVSTGPLDLGDVEILRDELARLLRGATDGAEYVFNDSIQSLAQDRDGVDVAFAKGPPRRFDLVIGADGLYSRVRELAFGAHDDVVHHLGTYLSVFTAPNFLDLDNWQLWHTGEEAGYIVFPVRDNQELRVTLTFQSPPLDYDARDIEAQKQLVADRLAHLGGAVPRMIEAMWKAEDFYFVPMAQVRMVRWSDRRITLLGDAGYCASPLSGQGTSLAIVGAYSLAAALKAADGDPVRAFADYEAHMRPYVTLNQAFLSEPDEKTRLALFEKARVGITLDR